MDFVMTADQEIDNYWFRLFESTVPSPCTGPDNLPDRGPQGIQAQAIIRYDGAPETEPSGSPLQTGEHPPLKEGDVVCPFLGTLFLSRNTISDVR